MVMIQFINYFNDINIDGTLPSTFLNQINALRTFILRFHCGDEFTIEQEINFNEECENFIKMYISKYMQTYCNFDTFYEEKEMQDITIEFYQIKRNLIISHVTLKICFLKRTISFSFV